MNYEQKLDLILNEIKHHYGRHPIDANWKRICRLITDGDGVETGNDDYLLDPQFLNYIDYLLDEKYIKLFTNMPAGLEYYVATVKGLKFEGFEEQRINLRTKAKIELRKSNILFIGSILAGIFSLIKIFQMLHPHLTEVKNWLSTMFYFD